MNELLKKVHEKLGLGIDIKTFASGTVEAYWKRDYGEGYGWSDERFTQADSIENALRSILEYEQAADNED